jgi:hypothetical protein
MPVRRSIVLSNSAVRVSLICVTATSSTSILALTSVQISSSASRIATWVLKSRWNPSSIVFAILSYGRRTILSHVSLNFLWVIALFEPIQFVLHLYKSLLDSLLTLLPSWWPIIDLVGSWLSSFCLLPSPLGWVLLDRGVHFIFLQDEASCIFIWIILVRDINRGHDLWWSDVVVTLIVGCVIELDLHVVCVVNVLLFLITLIFFLILWFLKIGLLALLFFNLIRGPELRVEIHGFWLALLFLALNVWKLNAAVDRANLLLIYHWLWLSSDVLTVWTCHT